MHDHTKLKDEIRLTLGKDEELLLLNNAGGFDERAKVRYGLGEGSPDLVGIIKPWGGWFFLEVKTGNAVMSHKQRMWKALLLAFGAYGDEVRSVADAQRLLAEAKQFFLTLHTERLAGPKLKQGVAK